MTSKYIFTDQHINYVFKKIVDYKHLFLFLDYDGTLAPFHDVPSRAKPLPGIINKIENLANNHNVSTTIISGRNINDLNKMINLSGLNYAGNHGLEINFKDGISFNWLTEKSNFDYKQFNNLKETIKKSISDNKTYHFEDKGAGFSIHFSNKKPEIKKYLKQQITNSCLEIICGRNIIEVRPKGWDKGKAVNFIIERIKEQSNIENYVTIYLGDDSTDEDAFQTITDGITIYVKNDAALKTDADYYLYNPEEVQKFLQKLMNKLVY